MAALDSTSFANMLKTLYPSEEVQNLATRKRKWLELVPKKDGFYGANMIVPVDYGNPMGRSATFSTAQSNAAASSNVKWTLYRKKDYGVHTFDAETIKASSNNKGAFVEAVKHDLDMLIDEVGHSAAMALYGTGSGSLGQIASGGITSATITLTNAVDTRHFAKGMVCAVAAAETGGSVRSGTITVASVSRSAGTVTFTGNVTAGISLAAALDYVYVAGDYDLKINGLAGWLPLSAPTSGDSWMGSDRSVDAERLAGCRLNNASGDMAENMITLGENVVEVGGEPDLFLINPTNYGNLIKGLSSKIVYQDSSSHVGLKSPMVMLSSGPVKVVADPECPPNRGYLLTLDTWRLHTLGEFPHVVMDDGRDSLRGATSDSIEVRVRYFANLVCTAPGRNGVMAI